MAPIEQAHSNDSIGVKVCKICGHAVDMDADVDVAGNSDMAVITDMMGPWWKWR